MAPSLSTKTLSLCSLFSLLLFLHVHGSSAREMKVEEEPPKQNEASHIYHPSQKDQKDAGKPYITSYGVYKRENQPYITGYINHKRVNQPYPTGYIHSQKDQKEKSESYTTPYGESKRENQPYITAYSNNKKMIQALKVNQAYHASYLHPQKDQNEKSGPYINAYGSSKRENQPYITSYGVSKKENQPYITAYSNSENVNQPYLTGYIQSHNDEKEKREPYLTAYDASKRENQPYITAYGHGKKDAQGENHKESYARDSGDSYAATYARGSGDSYAATYAKDSGDSYVATYGKEESGSTNAAAINKVDHTEAFKTGFFALDDLYVGNRMTLQFPIEDFPHFLTRKEADSIPFSSSQLPSVLQFLSIPQDSPEAQLMRGTLEQCELQPLTAERKVCVSSLESMIDFVRSVIGSDSQLDILTTTLPATSVPLQNFTVLEISPDFYAPKWVACHPLPYPYAVFYCHFIGSGTKIFKAKLGSENGEKMEALGVCHLDTSEWSPDHILFKRLGFKPGEAPVCHFLPVKHLVWIPLPSEATM